MKGTNMGNQPLHKYTPRWMLNIIETKKCAECGEKAHKHDICAIGVRSFGAEGKCTTYVEHKCGKCQVRTITSFAKEKLSSVEDLCYMIIEQIHAQKKLEKSKELSQQQNSNSQIGDDEVDALKQFLETNESHADFLKYIGSNEITEDDED